AALGGDANVGDTGEFGTEVGRQNVDFADGFERGLALCWLAEDAPVRTLAVEREARAVTLCAKEFEFAVGRTLGDVGVEVEEGIHVAAVSREFGDSGAADCFGDRLVFRIYGDRFGR